MTKVTIVGAGNVGATCANILTISDAASEIVLIDIKPGYAEGKALDIMQSQPTRCFGCKLIGVTSDYSKTANSDVVVITSGLPRKPGMTREDLIGVNAGIVKEVVSNVLEYSPNAILIIISNPMDTMTYLTCKTSNLPKNRVIGFGGVLDSSRFVYYLSQALNTNASNIDGMVIGGHGDTTMIPLKRLAHCKGVSVSELLQEDKLNQVVADTMVGGATLTKLLGTSAWMAPGSAAAFMVKAILHDEQRVIPCSVYLEGEYGQNDICLGVPVKIGKNGWESIVNLKLDEEEKALFEKSAAAVRTMNNVLHDMKIIE
ncbi:malate dehydrogenase [Microbacter margulisiae]|uniref:Malate dehydrogenase n=1 Tax=Microbacter margulisiae TaxID=1350067 RepID=A0A7W5DTW5_9PORP|nr:malate dehydrogenase [Microbacter margulisiae]MBB3188618.1 malate dehydrogenase [Microbacter margulisiae]